MNITRFVDPTPKYTNSSNDFMPYGLLYFYESGTNTDKTTFADVNETIANTQPLVLNGDGSVPNCFYSGSAKVVLITNAGTQAAPIDGDQQWEKDPVSSSAIGTVGRDWDAISIYDVNSVVSYSGVLWVSIINDNQNNIPSSVATAWTQFDLLKRFNINETYQLADPVIASDGFLYTSTINNNLGTDPTSLSPDWKLPTIALSNGINLLINGGMDFWQRGNTAVVGTGNEFTADRWEVRGTGGSGGTTTINRATTDGNGYVMEVVAAGHTDFFYIQQHIEAREGLNKYNGKTYSFSLNTSLASATPCTVEVFYVNSIDGTVLLATMDLGTIPSGVVVTESSMVFPSSISTNWDQDSSILIRIKFRDLLDGTYFIRKIKFEEGAVSTTFTLAGVTIAGELAMCQRYYSTVASATYPAAPNSTANRIAQIDFPVTMRAAPTVTASHVGDTPTAIDGATINGFRARWNSALNATETAITDWTASAEL